MTPAETLDLYPTPGTVLMASSLAAQLAKNVSLNASLLVDRSRWKPTQSYLFNPREADQHDLDSIHALAVNAFFRLKTVEPALSEYEEYLLSDAAKMTDRTLQNAETNARLNERLNSFLPLLGPYLLESPTGKLIEWLVRRFRVHEFNLEAVLALFLPYQESPHFIKMLSILYIAEDSKFAALIPHKSTSTPLSHKALVDLMLQPFNGDFSRYIGSLLPEAIRSPSAAAVHRGLIAFHTGTLLDFVKRTCEKRAGALEEGMLAWILPAAIEPLEVSATIEVESSKGSIVSETILSSYLLLCALAHTCPLSSKALFTILKAVVSCASKVFPKQVLRTLASICAAQDIDSFSPLPKAVIRVVMNLPGIEGELKDTLKFARTEKFIGPFVQGLASRLDDTRALDILTAFVTFQDVPQAIIQDLADMLVSQAIATEEHNATVLARGRSLLVHIQQRHPEPLQTVFETALKDAGDSKDTLEQLLISLSVDLPGAAASSDEVAESDMIIASTSADVTVRVIAIRELYKRLTKDDLVPLESATIRAALLARIHDTHVPVLEAFYSNEAALLPMLLADPVNYIQTTSQILHGQTTSPGRHIIKTHLSFIASHFYPNVASLPNADQLSTLVFEQVFFPFLLFSKPRQRTASLVWEIIKATEKSATGDAVLSRYELLSGCVEAVSWEEAKHQSTGTGGEDSYHSTEGLAKSNITIAAKIAENLVTSSSFSSHLDFLLGKLNGGDAHGRALSYLICRALLGYLSGAKQIETAHKVLTATRLDSLDNMEDFVRGSSDLQVFLHDVSLSTAVVLKPSKRATLNRLQVAVLAMVPTIQRPSGVALNWLENAQDDFRGARYMDLMRTVYSIVNSSSALPSLSSHITTTLFLNLAEDTLKFLAGIWLQSRTTPTMFDPCRYSALKHAAAFLEAHFSAQRNVDFQTVLPSILAATQYEDRRLREAALECVSTLVRLAQAKSPMAVYSFDAIYGADSADLQYLDWSDLGRYVQDLHSTQEHLINDGSYLRILHQQRLRPTKGETKKEAGYKQRIICYLLSHVNCCDLLSLKLPLLHSLEAVISPAKSQMLFPTVERLINANVMFPWLAGSDAASDQFICLVLACLDATAIDTLNERSGKPWSVYQRIIQYFFRSDMPSSARAVLASRLRSGLFTQLRLDRKVELCKILLEQGQEYPDIAAECSNLLGSLIVDVDVMIDLLSAAQPATSDVAHRASKRAKVVSQGNEAYSLLTFLSEILGAKSLPGSLDLVSHVLETLGKVVHDTSASIAEKTYVEQLLMSALEKAATNIPDGASFSGAYVRLDVLVELIRVSENPQTFNQALLLMATLSRLAPDAVLRNVMPIFTFMGSNVFHRDDTYSFRVVQKTIDGIIPVMVNSLKTSHADKLALHIASRSFLRIFTDAANHIPRHRRTHFFAHLIDVLGPTEFLAPVCLLLVDKLSSKVVRQASADVTSTLALPLVTLQRHSLELQFSALTEMLQEAQRLIAPEIKLATDVQSFLDSPLNEERGAQANTPKKQAHAILIFVRHALEQLASSSSRGPSPDRNTSSALLSSLLDLAVSKRARLTEVSLAHISSIADNAVRDALRVMSATDFIVGVLTVIETRECSILEGIFKLLAGELHNVSETVRQDSKALIIKIVDTIKKLISAANSQGIVSSALLALNSITTTLAPGEEHALTTAVPLVINSIRERRATAPALTTLLSLTSKLGPRTIPYFKEVVKECVSVLRDSRTEESVDSIAVLQALLASIPNFWSSPDLTQIVDLYVDAAVSMPQPQSALIWTLVKSMTKRVPMKTLVPVLCEYWTTMAASNEVNAKKIFAYFAVLKRAVHSADRLVVSDNLRPLSKTFLDAFELCSSNQSVRYEAKNDIIAAFIELTVKLNENTFKPLFRKVFDWAFSTSSDDGNKIVFCQVYMALLDFFKGLMTLYMSFLLPPFVEALNTYSKSPTNENLWLAIIQTITKSLVHDEGAFWREDKLRTVSAPLVAQIAISTELEVSEGRAAVSECIVALGDAVGDDTLMKKINLDVLMHTRAEDARLRLYALTCSEALWRTHGGKLMGFAGETATFVAECAEDDNDSVVREAHRLKNAIESVAGRIDL